MSSDVLLADVTTANPNVMYELGVRHASNRGPTVLLHAGGGRAPFYVSYLQMILYDPLGDLTHPDAVRARITETLRTAARRSDGSPLYEFFPELRVELPAGLRSAAQEARRYPDLVKSTLKRAARTLLPGGRRIDVEAAEGVLRSTPDAEPAAYLDVLRAYRNDSQWEQLIRAADSLPTELEQEPQVMQLVALALNRRSEAGDQDRAVALMRRLVDETGGDAETFGILGRIYKERWKTSGAITDLRGAVESYRRGFELQPTELHRLQRRRAPLHPERPHGRRGARRAPAPREGGARAAARPRRGRLLGHHGGGGDRGHRAAVAGSARARRAGARAQPGAVDAQDERRVPRAPRQPPHGPRCGRAAGA